MLINIASRQLAALHRYFSGEMERVFASAFANNPQKFYIRIGIRIRGCCRWKKPLHSHPHHAEADARIIVYLVILVYMIQNASDFLQKKQKCYYFWKNTYQSLTLNIN